MSALMQTYARLPVTFSHGEGVYLYDTDGRRYLDGISGIAVNGLGHAHPAVTAAIPLSWNSASLTWNSTSASDSVKTFSKPSGTTCGSRRHRHGQRVGIW